MLARFTLSRFTLLCCAAASFSPLLSAQPARDWASLGRSPAISTGMDIQVRTTDNKRHRGQFKAAEDDALVITTPSGEQRLPRAMVSRVALKTPDHRLRNTLIGLAVGAAAGLSLGAVADARCTGNCAEGKTPLGKEVGTGLGAVIGTIIGVALPTGGWRDVYRTP